MKQAPGTSRACWRLPITELQKKFYADLDRIRTEYERVIHAELRVVRQRLAPGAILPATTGPAEAASGLPFDYVRFADRFRGSEEYVSESQRFYLLLLRRPASCWTSAAGAGSSCN